jgi:glycosyltransferase involved in cell wall biosynthesis
MTIELSVVTATRNRAPVLRHALDALCAQSVDPARYELVVVDDGSGDETPTVLEQARRTARCEIRVVRLGARRGVAAARNRGIREARGEIIVFVDDDALAPPGFLAAHLDAHTTNTSAPGIVCRGPVIAARSLDRPFEARGGLLDVSTAYFDTDNGSARRSHLLDAGLFDETLFPYGWEGLDLGIRLRRMGLRRVFRRDAPLYHYQAASDGHLTALLAKEEERARTARLFYAKHPTLEARFAVQLTPLHLWLNALQRGFGLVRAENVEAWIERARRWRLPGLGRVLLSGVLNERYLSCLWSRAGAPGGAQER